MTTTRTSGTLVTTLAVGLATSTLGAAPADDGAEFFEKHVRPVLVERCIACHGPDKQSSGLRLDTREGLFTGGSGEGAAVVPGKPGESPLVRAVTHEDDVLKMPPKRKLADDQIAAIQSWVQMGAPWPAAAARSGADAWQEHWAFRPVRVLEPTADRDGGPIGSPVDAFLLAKLRSAGLAFSSPADRRTLLRRVTFDLIGLPPSPEEVEAFERDDDPDAFAKVVERLLASPHYGERWGRHWLDVARYADTKGYVFQEERRYPYSYTYRDYVVDAFNRDKPYNQFVVEQLAADLLPPDDPKRLAALGFLTVGRRFLNNNEDIIDDRIDVVTRGLLGVTVACARCHDHKYDPVPTEDYYSLYGVFASCVEPAELPLIGEAPAGPEAEDYQKQRAERLQKADDYLREMNAAYRDDLVARLGDYLATAADLHFEAAREKLDDAARSAKVRPESLRWVADRWPGTIDHHPAVFGPWKAFAALPADGFAAQAAELAAKFDSATNPLVAAAFAANPPTSLRDAANLYGTLFRRAKAGLDVGPAREEDIANWPGLLVVIDDSQGPVAVPVDDTRRVFNRAEREKYQGLQRKVAELDVTHPGAPPRAMVLSDKAEPVNPQVFLRGNPGRRGKQVPRRFLKLIDGEERQPYAKGSGRLAMAESIARPDNPLTARVMVNRIWMHHFGTPLVGTPSDFGLRSDAPTHPELLDYLAQSFVDSGWSVKAVHRLILLSDSYRQESLDRPDARAIDPENRLLWRANRRRLDFEATRDALLAAAGRLDLTLGGRAAPLFEGNGSTRRTLYGFIDRQNLDGVYRTFDFAVPDATSPKRYATTVPQQALFLMNSPFVNEQARSLAHRPEVDGAADDDARIHSLYRDVFGRPAAPEEVETGRRFVAAFEAADGKLSAWEAYAQVLLLTNEFLFID